MLIQEHNFVRPKYEAPWREHPDTDQTLNDSDIYANPIEVQNAVLRRRKSAFRRRTHTLRSVQRRLTMHFGGSANHPYNVRCHWTTGLVPAVALDVIKEALCLEDILTGRFS